MGKVATQVGGGLIAAPRTNSAVFDLSGATLPGSWRIDQSTQNVIPAGAGTVAGTVSVAAGGTYGVYLAGSFARTVTIFVDGDRVGSFSGMLNEEGQWTPFGSLKLAAGSHTITLRYGGSELAPGAGAGPFEMGPLALSLDQPEKLVRVAAANAGSLCGKSLDWLELVGP